MDYNTLMNCVPSLPVSTTIDPHSLHATFEQITDGRHKRGLRYPLAVLLSLMVLAKLSGETTLNGVVEWARHRRVWLAATFHLAQSRCPCFSTYTYALGKLSAEEVTTVLAQAFCRAEARRRCGSEPARLYFQGGRASKAQIALDGKTLRGTLGHTAPQQPLVHQLSCYEVVTGIVLATCVVQHKENEISAPLPPAHSHLGERTHHQRRRHAHPTTVW